jgi:hypothetical protein
MKMNLRFLAVLVALFSLSGLAFGQPDNPIRQSYFKLTTSNGRIVAVYNAKENRIDDVYPHIFANYDSGIYVHPFIGNISLATTETPLKTSYQENTHVISVQYKEFIVSYFASFTRNDQVFYIVIRGKKEVIENLAFDVESGEGKPVSGISLLENHLQDLPIRIKGKVLTGSLLKLYHDDIYEKYFLYSLQDSLQTDPGLVENTIIDVAEMRTSLLDEEVRWMKNFFSTCIFPHELIDQERNVAEQSISILKMSQVSDYETIPGSHGQIMASLRPGLWHIAWVRDGSYAIQAMTRLGMYAEARKGLEFMLKAESGRYKHYIYTDGKDYGPGVDYQVSLTRYFGNGKEECDYNEFGPNIEFDDFGLFLCAFTDYVIYSGDKGFYHKWNEMVRILVADATIHCIDPNGMIKEDSGPWEHHLQMPRQYTFTSGVCARGLEMFASLQKEYGLPYEKYESAAGKIKQALMEHTLIDGKYFKGNSSDKLKTDKEYYDAGVYEIFANGLFSDKNLFLSHMAEYDNYLRIKGKRPGYIRLNTSDPYENQEWVFINLRIALARIHFGEKEEAAQLINFVTEQAALNYNTIPEMYSNELQMKKVPEGFYSWNVWCNCIREEDKLYIGTIPMVGYGSGAYIITLYNYYGR